ncbi:hypothetical protein CYMTET_21094 [Cymbomonas tetramitiformis]|uniref:Uncharacterized protein n=1 Tax=Cymbomonas tetramitiformis TaxID=36881 RepID=A0AAE0G3H5_9CHLO|nr:hypothetical protein CYMTET_21094 [Cymbomonas tetramitiformis]
MATTRSLARRQLLKESDVDSIIRLNDTVLNSPTLATPPVPAPGVDKDISKLGKLIVRVKTAFSTSGVDLTSFDFDDPNKAVIECVNELLYDTFEELIEPDSTVAQYFLATDSSTDRDGCRALLDLIKGCVPTCVRQSHQEEHAALRYPARVDPRPILAKEVKLCKDNQAEDWKPTEVTRRQQLYKHLDPDFYKGIFDRYPLPEHLPAMSLKQLSQLVTRVYTNWQFAEQDGTAGTVASPAVATGDDSESRELLRMIVKKFQVLEHFIKNQKGGAAVLWAADSQRGGLARYRTGAERGAGSGVGVPTAFDPQEKKAVPKCFRCSKQNLFHAFRDCPLGGRKDMAAYCCPLDGVEPEQVLSLALCQVFQDAADAGRAAFAQAISDHGAPAMVHAGGDAVGVDLSAYGFSLTQGSEAGGMLAELDDISGKLAGLADAAGLSFIHCEAITRDDGILTCSRGCCVGPVCAFEGIPCGELCLHGGIEDLSPELQTLVLDRFFLASASASGGAPGGGQLQSGGVDMPADLVP